ncbi:uncharacterized protein METZ01_LOCUS186201, partial [marine metagenome]
MIIKIKSFFLTGGISLFAAAGLMTLTGCQYDGEDGKGATPSP